MTYDGRFLPAETSNSVCVLLYHSCLAQRRHLPPGGFLSQYASNKMAVGLCPRRFAGVALVVDSGRLPTDCPGSKYSWAWPEESGRSHAVAGLPATT